MNYTNEDIAKIFEKIAKLMEYHWMNQKTDFFRLRAYQNAAQNIKNFPYNISELYQNQELEEIPGLWKDLMNKVKELLENWKIKKYEELKKDLPENILELFDVPWIWPKQTKLFYENLGITKISELEDIINNNPEKMLQLPRMWEQKLKQIMQWIQMHKKSKERVPIGFIYPEAEKLRQKLLNIDWVKDAYITWSLRRMKESIWDIDILIITDNIHSVNKTITQMENIWEVIAQWWTKTSLFLKNPPIQIDIRYIDKTMLWSALQYFTWSQSHNIKLRIIAKQKWMKISEYWIFDWKNKIWWEKENEIYKNLGLSFVPPELREDNGEIQKAQKWQLPELVDYKSLKWDLHIHSNRSDAESSCEDIVKKASELGYKYIAITDHSQSLTVANWLDEERMEQKTKEIQKLRKKYPNIKILMWTECDILKDWNLDYSNNILKKCDIVIASLHYWFSDNNTQKYLQAMENPFVNIIWHPTTRKFWLKNELELDREKIFQKAIEKNIAMEVNSQPERLDLKDKYIKHFISMWGKICINTDSHTIKSMEEIIKYWIWQARRWWAEKKDVINTRNYKNLINFLNKKIWN